MGERECLEEENETGKYGIEYKHSFRTGTVVTKHTLCAGLDSLKEPFSYTISSLRCHLSPIHTLKLQPCTNYVQQHVGRLSRATSVPCSRKGQLGNQA